MLPKVTNVLSAADIAQRYVPGARGYQNLKAGGAGFGARVAYGTALVGGAGVAYSSATPMTRATGYASPTAVAGGLVSPRDQSNAMVDKELGKKGLQEVLRLLGQEYAPDKILQALALHGDAGLQELLDECRFRVYDSMQVTAAVQPVTWQQRFETSLKTGDISGVDQCTREFVYRVSRYGEIIISEKDYPVHLKTIKPITMGGVAGGDK